MRPPVFSKVSLLLAMVAALMIGGAMAISGGAIFSPGDLHAGDSSVVTLGGVTSHAQLEGTCGACHAAPGSASTMADRCLACHEDIQRELPDTTSLHGAFDGDLAKAASCMSCHTEHRGHTGSLTRMDGFATAHGQFGFALDAHVTQASGDPFSCASCHTSGSYRFDARECESCHRDYQSAFVTKHIASWGTNCQSCHDGTDRFGRGRFAHDTTGFRLDGAHVRSTCQACHSDVTTLADYGKAPRDCAGCHTEDDKHRGSFGPDCASCHTTSTWEGATFSHDVFPLDHGEGGRIACKTCHTDPKNYKSYTCMGCHEHSPARIAREHEGEVRAQDLSDCLRCHRGGRSEGGGGDEHEGRRRRRGDDGAP